MGSKKRVAAELYQIMRAVEEELYGAKKLPYFEPFCGMMNVAKEFDDGRPRTVCDLNADVIKMWQAVMKGWRPPKANISKAYYDKLKYSQTPSAERGFYGTACSFGGAFFSGFSGDYGQDTKQKINCGINNIMEYKKRLTGIKILNPTSYTSHHPIGKMIYCDPPYSRTLGKMGPAKLLNKFDSNVFWDTVRKWSKNNLVFVSEEKAPSDFVAIWSKVYNRTGRGWMSKGSVKTIDKLFIHKSYIK